MPKPPVLFNRLGSTAQTTTSVLGASGTEAASTSYTAAEFGNGQSATGVNKYISFPATTAYTGNAGCIECWLAPSGWSLTNGLRSSGIGWSWSIFVDGSNYMDMIFNSTGFQLRMSSGGSQGGMTGYAGHADVDVSDGVMFHWAAVWNTTGIDGGSDTQRIYFNNGLVRSSTASLTAPVGSGTLYLGDYGNSLGNPFGGIIDNFKIYNYDKIDFSDRFNERGGLNDQTLVL